MRSRKAIVNIFTSLLFQSITVICGFIIPKLIIKNYGSNVNGVITSITQFLAYITLLESGFGPVVKSVLYGPIARNDKSKIEEILKSSEKFFRTISYIFIAYILILCCVLPFILSKEFNVFFSLSLIVIISISIFSEYYFGMTYRLFLQAEQKTYVINIIRIGTLIVNTILIIVLVHIGANIQIVKLGSALIFILRPILQNLYVKKKYDINIKAAKSEYKIKQKWDGLAQHIASVVHNNTDVVILTLFINTVEVSVYSIYTLVVSGIRNLIQAFTGGVDASFGDMIAKGEKENLRRSFKTYEGFYYTISSIIGISTIFLILPFVSIYTKGIHDADYIRPLFAYLIVLAEFMWIIRLPYSSITLAAGHFRETQKGAWIEAGTNILLSMILVWKFGIVGVAIGTLTAMTIRTIEFMYHASKYILERNIWESFTRLGIIIIELLIVFVIYKVIPHIDVTNYINWIIQAIIVASITAVVVISINCLIYRKNVKNVLNIGKNLLKIRR